MHYIIRAHDLHHHLLYPRTPAFEASSPEKVLFVAKSHLLIEMEDAPINLLDCSELVLHGTSLEALRLSLFVAPKVQLLKWKLLSVKRVSKLFIQLRFVKAELYYTISQKLI